MVTSCLGFFIICMVFTSVSGFSNNLLFSSFTGSFSHLYGDDHVIFLDQDGKSVQISLDDRTGSGFISQNMYLYAYFSSSIKLPANYSAGVVVTFYTSNENQYKTNHDELDFEFLGNIRSRDWLVQTNIYGNGSTSRGREERYKLWFDPTEDFHTYSIFWTSKWIIFYVDGVPIREVQRVDAMGGDFPSKPMSLYATIWDGSAWATSGGRYKVDYKYAPFIAKYSNFLLHGCSVDPTQERELAKCNNATEFTTFNGLTTRERSRMNNVRRKYMIYSYCCDRPRYPNPLPECLITPHVEGKL